MAELAVQWIKACVTPCITMLISFRKIGLDIPQVICTADSGTAGTVTSGTIRSGSASLSGKTYVVAMAVGAPRARVVRAVII